MIRRKPKSILLPYKSLERFQNTLKVRKMTWKYVSGESVGSSTWRPVSILLMVLIVVVWKTKFVFWSFLGQVWVEDAPVVRKMSWKDGSGESLGATTWRKLSL